MASELRFELEDPLATDHFGECLAKIYLHHLKNTNTCIPFILLLDGEVGAGKSCVGRAMIKYLTHEEIVQSPSYLVSLSYTMTILLNNISEIKIHHIDPYRLKSTQKLKQMIDMNQIMNDVVILEHAHLTDVSDMFDQRYVVRVHISGKKVTHKSGFDSVLTHSLVSMGRSVEMKTSSDCVFDLSMFGDIQDPGIITEQKHDPHESNESKPPHHKDMIIKLQRRLKDSPNDVLIMGIETSCDDTCIAIINGLGEILVNYQIGQNDIHKEYGGVHPMFAKQAHQENLNIYMDKALQDIYDKYSRYPDVIGFTIGPGLEVCLVAGVSKVHEISHRYNIPIIPTHHMESHIMVCRIPGLNLGVEYPFVSCVVSGGHTFIAYVEAEGVYRLLSTTTDDSMGETIDKVGRELGLINIPAGRDFEELAIGGDNKRFAFPRTSIKKKPYDLSFSGLKSFTIGAIKKNIKISDDSVSIELEQLRSDFAASFQEHIMEYLVSQFRKIYQKFLFDKKINCVVLAGGVASNTVLRTKMEGLGRDIGVPVKYPPPNLCTDNGVMVAWNGCEKLKSGFLLEPEQGYDPSVRCEVRARWKLW